MRAWANSRTGGKRASPDTTGAASRAARSVCWMAQVFGAASASTKMTITSTASPSTTPSAPRWWRSLTRPTSVPVIRLHASTRSRIGLRKRSGRSVSRLSRLAPRRPSSSRAMALTLLMRVRLVSARAKNAVSTRITPTVTAMATSMPVMPRGPGGTGRAARARGAPWWPPPRRRRGPCPSGGGCRGRGAGPARPRRWRRARWHCGSRPPGR